MSRPKCYTAYMLHRRIVYVTYNTAYMLHIWIIGGVDFKTIETLSQCYGKKGGGYLQSFNNHKSVRQ